jgi:hypothetical protein
VLGGKDVVEGRDERTDVSDSYWTYSCKNGITCPDSFYILPLVNTVGWHGIFEGEVDFHANISSMYRGRAWQRGGSERSQGGANGWIGGVNGYMRPSDRRIRPSGSRMRPTVFRMCPLRRHMRPSNRRMRPSASVCAPQPAVCSHSNPNHLTWQWCGSHCGQSKSRFTLSKVNKTLILIGRTRTLSDMTDGQDGRTDA